MLITTPRSRRFRALAAATCLGLLATACGDDDDATASADGETASASTDEYCDFVRELDSQDGPPTEEQIERLKQIRPEEIGEDTDKVADAFIAAGGDVGQIFADPELEEAFGRMEAHDAEVCGIEVPEGEEQATEPLDGAQVIEVTAVDYGYEGIPAEVPAGPTSFAFSNEGEDGHEMLLARLGDGVDLDQLLAEDREPTAEEAEEIGGVFAPSGEGGVYLNAENLEPGTYAVVCFIPGPDGKPHHELGMKTTFRVS